ncbi:hypothetical protein VNO78_03212 [Psophocarpus tetragonolobus]|uniref:Protein kinase domain-containing protein n=1 Tax=Psophocarpus tetragonolobus TaxID=3891 RepID=A0AAN9T157_PSOTE
MLALLLGGLYLYSQFRKRKLIKIRESYFLQNGGLVLQKQVAKQGSTKNSIIFSAQELKKATNYYDKAMIIGKGGHGTVYKGILSNSRVVAIKKSNISGQIEIEQFINEMIVVSQINHKNIVKLLGCCLEAEVPMLVYEFITNGTLLDHMQVSQLSWPNRLRIATETAEALAYLHSAASPPIIHRDVKTANILLDDNLTAKVSDFGASKLVPIDQTQLTTLVQELFTSMKAVSFIRPQKERNLSMYFVSVMKEGHLPDILDKNIVDANVEQIIEVANLAKRCLMVKGKERPTMKEVAMELLRIKVFEKHSLETTKMSSKEIESSLKIPRSPYNTEGEDGNDDSGIIIDSDSIQTQVLEPLLDEGR